MTADLWTRTATDLAARIAAGDISSAETVASHVARIRSVDGVLNAVVVERFEAALAEARAADARRARGERLGPLHGVPITVKEQLDLAGTPSTFGVTSRATDRAERDDPYVARLRAAGAIVTAKTNVPQLLIFIETDNPLYGRTNNPWDLSRSPGGSSGGESAIVAAGGSPLGLGTDIGGSLRSPAAACGLYSLKPTTGRCDDASRLATFAGQREIVSQAGPLARSVADCALALELINGGRAPDVVPSRPLRDPYGTDVRGLRVGYYDRLGDFAPSPALARATREAALELERAGAHVVPFDPPHVAEAMEVFYGILSADGAAGALELLGSDPQDPRVRALVSIASKPRAFVAALARVLSFAGQRGLASVVGTYGRTETRHYWKLVEAAHAYRALFADAMDRSPGGPLDLIVAPPCGLPALRHGAAADVLTAGAYAPLYNVLSYPCGTVPFTRVRAGEETTRPRSRDGIERAAIANERGSRGLPVGVQLIGRPWREDVVLAGMFALETGAADRPDSPVTPITPPAP